MSIVVRTQFGGSDALWQHIDYMVQCSTEGIWHYVRKPFAVYTFTYIGSGESHCGCAVPVSTKSHNSCDLVGSFKDTVLLIIIVGVWTGASNARPQNLPDLWRQQRYPETVYLTHWTTGLVYGGNIAQYKGHTVTMKMKSTKVQTLGELRMRGTDWWAKMTTFVKYTAEVSTPDQSFMERCPLYPLTAVFIVVEVLWVLCWLDATCYGLCVYYSKIVSYLRPM